MTNAGYYYYVILICFNLLLLLTVTKHTIYTPKHKLWHGIIIRGTNLSEIQLKVIFISAYSWSSLAYQHIAVTIKKPRFELIECAAEVRIFVLLLTLCKIIRCKCVADIGELD